MSSSTATFNTNKIPNTFGSISSLGTDSSDAAMVDQEDIQQLSDCVRRFSEALSALKTTFQQKDEEELMKVRAHEGLAAALSILKNVLQKYDAIQSVGILTSAGKLITAIKAYSYVNSSSDTTAVLQGIDELALSFSSRLSGYLLGDIDMMTNKFTSDENLIESDATRGSLNSEQVDASLHACDNGVEIALHRAKVWTRYARNIITFVEKRVQIDTEHAKKLSALSQTIKPMIKEESFLPFQSIYCTALDQDFEHAGMSQATYNLLSTQKFVEPLAARIIEHERVRKTLRDTWMKEVKKLQEAATDLRKARSAYIQRQQEYEKARDAVQKADEQSSSKIEKKKKVEEDMLYKAAEAETTYKACVAEANLRHASLNEIKLNILSDVRELICQCDQTMKAVTVSYFQLLNTLATPVPIQLQILWESSRLYEPGSQYMEFVKQLPVNLPNREPEKFVFEPYSEISRVYSRSKVSDDSRDLMEQLPMLMRYIPGEKDGKNWSDTDSMSDSSIGNGSPIPSPWSKPLPKAEIGEGRSLTVVSRAAATHNFKKLERASKCRECDSYVFFQGYECTKCGLSSHKNCLETLAIQCGNKGLYRRMTTFGVDVSAHVQQTHTEVPPIVEKCIADIDARGLTMKGIYRLSGVKSKVEHLCQEFESGSAHVDIEAVSPIVVANVLKLYLRQLPEPLLTYKLYDDFIQLAKDYPCQAFPLDGKEKSSRDEEILQNLQKITGQLPGANYKTTAILTLHLNNVHNNRALNQMSAENLGIIFGPTLLRSCEREPLHYLQETQYQTRAVELLINCSEQLFGKTEQSNEAEKKDTADKQSEFVEITHI